MYSVTFPESAVWTLRPERKQPWIEATSLIAERRHLRSGYRRWQNACGVWGGMESVVDPEGVQLVDLANPHMFQVDFQGLLRPSCALGR